MAPAVAAGDNGYECTNSASNCTSRPITGSVLLADTAEQFLQLAYLLRLLGVQIVSLGNVLRQIVKLTGLIMRLIAALVLEPLRLAAALGAAVVVAGRAVDQHEVASANGKTPARRVMHGGRANRLLKRLTAQGRQNVVAVFARIIRQLCTENCGNRREEIDMANRFPARRAGRNLARPTSDVWHAMPAFPGVALTAPQFAHAGMSIFLQPLYAPGRISTTSGPLSLVKMTSVLSAAPVRFRASSTCPTTASL